MKRYLLPLLLMIFFSLTVGVIPARADGIIIPEPPVCLPEPCPPLPREGRPGTG